LKKKIIKKISLGTAQFGINYGINEKKINFKEIKKIINYSNKIKIKKIDTAIAYGKSEKILGSFSLKNWRITTKIPAYRVSYGDPEKWAKNQINNSLNSLRVKRLHGVLFHNTNDLFNSNGKKIYKALLNLKKRGLIKKIGISIYDFKNLNKILKIFKIDIVQVPFNIIDRRLLKSSLLDLQKKNKIELQVRSIFLQGLLFKNLKYKNLKFNRFTKIWTALHNWLYNNKYNLLDVCINDCLRYNFDSIIIGFENLNHLKRIINYKKINNLRLPVSFSSNKNSLINPTKWN
jgi:aryl-alcohol dehydrogenase-like predicted oxidoreductase